MKISIDCVDKGFKNRNAKWRIAWSKDTKIWNPNNDARCSEYMALKNNNEAKVIYYSGSKRNMKSYVICLGLDKYD
jgi:hypothetical protein